MSPARSQDHVVEQTVVAALRAAREHLGLEVAFVSQLAGGQRVFRWVDADLGESCPIEVGAAAPEEETYCHYVANGSLPEFLSDPREHPVAAGLQVTHEFPVGTHLSVPIELTDGTVFGTFCCFSRSVRPGLSPEDVKTLRVLAAVVQGYVEELERSQAEWRRRRDELRGVAARGEIEIVYQPIVELATGTVTGVESLARFPTLTDHPERVFHDAWDLGVGLDLELRTVERAMRTAAELPPGVHLAVNASPALLGSPQFKDVVQEHAPEHTVIEVTEHAAVEDYDLLHAAVDELSALGIQLAVDDVGTGFSGLAHILRLDPRILKIDGALVEGVDRSESKQAMISALVAYGARRQTRIVAERVETKSEATALRVLGVGLGQGFHLGRPGRLENTLLPDPAG